MNRLIDFSSRFRILKGGKVSLIVGSLLLGSSLNCAALTFTDSGVNTTLSEDSTLTISSGTHNITSGNSAVQISGSSSNYTIAVINDGIVNITDSLYGIYTYITKDGSSITNNGTVNSNHSSGTAYGLYTTLKSSDTITNNGTILVNGSLGSIGIYLNGATVGGIVSNSGAITAKQNGNLDSNSYAFYSSVSNVVTVNNSGTMNGNIKLTKGTFTNSGTVSLPHNATNASIENFVNEATGILEIGLKTTDGVAGNATYSKLTTTNATFNSGSTIKVNVQGTDSNVTLLKDAVFNDVVSATGTLTVNGTLNITDNSALLNFERVNNDATTIDIKAVQAQSVGQTISGNNSNAKAAAGTLQIIVDNSGSYSQMNGVVTALNGLSTNAQVERAVDSTTPQTTTSSFTASSQISNNVSNIVTQRQTITMNGASGVAGVNSGDELLASKNVWVKPYGSLGSQSDKNGINGFDIDTYGIGIGFDGEYKKDKQIGMGFFYTKADVDVNNVSQNSDIDVYSLIFYGNEPIVDDKTHFLYQLGYSYQDTSSQRDIAFMSTNAKADYESHVASVDLRVLRDYQINKDVLLQPLVSTTYRYFKTPSYSETGAGALNLDVKDFSSSEVILGVGTLAYYTLDKDSRLFGNVNVGYDLKDDNNIVTSSYQGASGLSFDTAGIDNGRVSYDLGMGYENDLTELSNLSFTYNYQGEGTDYTNHVVSAKYTYKF